MDDNITIKEALKQLGASTEVVNSFIGNGYCTIDDLNNITDYELKLVIPQVFLRKKFAQALIPWLIAHDQPVDEGIAMTAGLHPSQTRVELGTGTNPVTIVTGSDCDKSECSSSTKSLYSSKPLSSTDEFGSTSKSGTSDATDFIDLSQLDLDFENIEKDILLEEDLARANNFKLTSPDNTEHVIYSLENHKNPIWVLLNKGTLESKRIASLPNDTLLTPSEIKEIAQITATHLFSEASPPKRQVTPNTCSHWANEYFQSLFPNTGVHRFYFIKREIYENKFGKTSTKGRPTGALYTQLCLLRKKLLLKDDAAKIRQSSVRSDQVNAHEAVNTPQKIDKKYTFRPLTKPANEYSPPAPENETIDSKLATLRNELPTHASADLLELWTDTHGYRMTELKETPGSVWDYINLYKGLLNPAIGPVLINKDFELLFGTSSSSSRLQDFLLSKKNNIIDLAKDTHTKLAAEIQRDLIKSFLQLTEGDEVIIQTTGLLLLLPLLFPGVYQVNKHWKPIKSQVLNAFVMKVNTEAEVEDGIASLRIRLGDIEQRLKWKETLHLQPFILAVGHCWTDIVQVHIVLDKVIYSLPSIPEAVELCFKLYHAFHAEYPLECHNVWEFLQQAVYNIRTDFDWNHRSTSELAEQLGITINQEPKQKTNKSSISKKK